MRSKSPKEKQGVARLFELAGQRGRKLTLACVLSVLSSAARIVPFFTIYGVVRELLAHYQEPSMVDQNAILTLCVVTFGAALVYGLCAFISSALSHTAASARSRPRLLRRSLPFCTCSAWTGVWPL